MCRFCTATSCWEHPPTSYASKKDWKTFGRHPDGYRSGAGTLPGVRLPRSHGRGGLLRGGRPGALLPGVRQGRLQGRLRAQVPLRDLPGRLQVWLELNKVGAWWCDWEVLEVVVEGAVGDVGGEGREGVLRGERARGLAMLALAASRMCSVGPRVGGVGGGM